MENLNFDFIADPFEREFFVEHFAEREGAVSLVVARELGFLDAAQVCDRASLPERFRGRGWLWRRVEKSLTAYCARHCHPVARCAVMGQMWPLWPPGAVAEWLDAEGRELINDFMAKPGRSAQIIQLRPKSENSAHE
jgi:hypothetical protein